MNDLPLLLDRREWQGHCTELRAVDVRLAYAIGLHLTRPRLAPCRVDPKVDEVRVGDLWGKTDSDEVGGKRHWPLLVKDSALANKLWAVGSVEEQIAVFEHELLNVAARGDVLEVVYFQMPVLDVAHPHDRDPSTTGRVSALRGPVLQLDRGPAHRTDDVTVGQVRQ